MSRGPHDAISSLPVSTSARQHIKYVSLTACRPISTSAYQHASPSARQPISMPAHHPSAHQPLIKYVSPPARQQVGPPAHHPTSPPAHQHAANHGGSRPPVELRPERDVSPRRSTKHSRVVWRVEDPHRRPASRKNLRPPTPVI